MLLQFMLELPDWAVFYFCVHKLWLKTQWEVFLIELFQSGWNANDQVQKPNKTIYNKGISWFYRPSTPIV